MMVDDHIAIEGGDNLDANALDDHVSTPSVGYG